MDLQAWLSGAFSTAGLGAVALAIFQWIRYRKRDKANVRKLNAESMRIEAGVITEGYTKLIDAMNSIRQEEKNMFQKMIDEERQECDLKMEKMRKQHEGEINQLKTELGILKETITNTQ